MNWLVLALSLPVWDLHLEREAPRWAEASAYHWLTKAQLPTISHPTLQKPAAVFVTLVKNDRIRGCWGSVHPQTPSLRDEIVRHTRMALVGDGRFPPVVAEELPEIHFLVSLVGPLQPVRNPQSLRPKLEGLLVTQGAKTGVLLPGEAKTAAWQVQECLRKAGLSSLQGSRLYRFRTLLLGDRRP